MKSLRILIVLSSIYLSAVILLLSTSLATVRYIISACLPRIIILHFNSKILPVSLISWKSIPLSLKFLSCSSISLQWHQTPSPLSYPCDKFLSCVRCACQVLPAAIFNSRSLPDRQSVHSLSSCINFIDALLSSRCAGIINALCIHCTKGSFVEIVYGFAESILASLISLGQNQIAMHCLFYLPEIVSSYMPSIIHFQMKRDAICKVFPFLQCLGQTTSSSQLYERGGGLAQIKELSPKHYRLRDHIPADQADKFKGNGRYTITRDRLENIIHLAPHRVAQKIAKLHGITRKHNINVLELRSCFRNHECSNCNRYVSVLEPKSQKIKLSNVSHKSNIEEFQPLENFPPEPPSEKLCETIITDFCHEFDADNIVERGCAVCGQLTSTNQLSKLSAVSKHLDLLESSAIACKERRTINDPQADIPGPILATGCNEVCNTCRRSLREGKVPQLALARNLWVGDVPPELKTLTFIEKLMISRVRHNTCYATVASGAKKLRCNIISFETNLPKVYSMLPPPMSDMDSYIAVLFSSPTEPTEQLLKRTPFLVRRNMVARALEWLTLNHPDYADVAISTDNLNEYPDNGVPVNVLRHKKPELKSKDTVDVSVFDDDSEDGVEDGPCPFVVHGLVASSENTLTSSQLKAKAVQHWNRGQAALSMGRGIEPVQSFNNPKWWPQMFPWLFPYGCGSIGMADLSEEAHKRFLLMYYDKRFQADEVFTLAAFNHEQLRKTSSAGFLVAEKKEFPNICDRLLSLHEDALKSVVKRLMEGENFFSKDVKRSEEEQKCFQVLSDLDHVSGKVPGSVTSKKWMNNEVWAMIHHFGAPLWYVTINPADKKHPLCLYWASNNLKYEPDLQLNEDDRRRLIAMNPTAGARFFNFIVQNFITHVLGMNGKHNGYFGKTKAYYGTVEQQGRLSLHMHMLIWIDGGLTPEETRKRIMDPESDFQKKFFEYLEGCHQGHLFDGSSEEIEKKIIDDVRKKKDYIPPTNVVPEPPPEECFEACKKCPRCSNNQSWWQRFKARVNDLILISNKHRCGSNIKKDGARKLNTDAPGCMDNKWKKCKARFPREVVENTFVVNDEGSIKLKHLEKWINCFSPLVTYLIGCNTDITSLRSGTAIKAVLLYITNYITKVSLKTYTAFEVILSVFQRNVDYRDSNRPREEKARALMTKMVNGMTARLEIGGPMAAMYLLRFPDHYTNCRFKCIYWSNYVQEVNKAWNTDIPSFIPEKIPIMKKKKRFTGVSPVEDYVYRPADLEDLNLYDWIARTERVKIANVAASTDSSTSKDCHQDQPSMPRTGGRNVYPFLRTHQLHKTHAIRYNSESQIVPNLLGPSLPRRDTGDREYYCMTMLTLLRPWRSGVDLKLREQAWHEAFLKAPFTRREEEIMSNFHIKHECKDASDDYMTQMKTNDESEIIPSLADGSDMLNHQLMDSTPNGALEHSDDDLHMIEDIQTEILGRKQLNRRLKFETTKRMLIRLRMDTVIENTSKEEEKCHSFEAPSHITPKEWDRIIQDKKTGIQLLKAQNVTAKPQFPKIKNAHNEDKVEIVTKAYLERKYTPEKHRDAIKNIQCRFSLNKEQERAYRIVTNHASNPLSEQLKMIIAGMGGTGKSQVIKALKAFFHHRKEAHRFMIVAPTGNAAALLGGSTYHSAFGINERVESSQKALNALRDRLIGVEYVFFDEVSMLSARDLYRINQQLAKITGNKDVPFGGLNFIFAGDFAQLPPAVGGESSSLYSRNIGRIANKIGPQEAAIGKAIWHQVTTVVILRENMRQKIQSKADQAFRKALENMRYKDCTKTDIAFLNTRVCGEERDKPHINETTFRNVAVITGRHIEKDVFNEVGCLRWAKEHNQELLYFVSEDETAAERNEKTQIRRTKVRQIQRLSQKQQQQLWDQPSDAVDEHIPGTLALCLGMPVTIRQNIATELCMTRGQDGIVVGWNDRLNSQNRRVLEVLFVKLFNPPQTVQVDGLPQNIVPITKTSTPTVAWLPDDSTVYIYRSQVNVIPNFAMTDFASQGKTREFNVVDLHNLKNHHAYYTALSRSSSATGTLILQGFDESVVKNKASAALRQEFRELEILDEITLRMYEGTLPLTFQKAESRNALIDLYRTYLGPSHMPKNLHPALEWKPKDPFLMLENADVSWYDIPSVNEERNVVDDKSKYQGQKRKESPLEQHEIDNRPSQRRKITSINDSNKDLKELLHHELSIEDSDDLSTVSDSKAPVMGSQWNNNSCAYDAVISILYNAWLSFNITMDFKTSKDQVFDLTSVFNNTSEPINKARDKLRDMLAQEDNERFRFGNYTSVHDIWDVLLSSDTPITMIERECQNVSCSSVKHSHLTSEGKTAHIMLIPFSVGTIQAALNSPQVESSSRCCTCSQKMILRRTVQKCPDIIAIDLSNRRPKIDYSLQIRQEQGYEVYDLVGLIYYRENPTGHFTCRIFDCYQVSWHHDGLDGSNAMFEGPMRDLDLHSKDGSHVISAIYVNHKVKR
jgi:hypothetical protein